MNLKCFFGWLHKKLKRVDSLRRNKLTGALVDDPQWFKEKQCPWEGGIWIRDELKAKEREERNRRRNGADQYQIRTFRTW